MTSGVQTRLEGTTLVVRIPMRFQAPGRPKAHPDARWHRHRADLETAAGRHAGQGAGASVAMAEAARRRRLRHGQRDRRRPEHLEKLREPDSAPRAASARHRRGDPRRKDGPVDDAGDAGAAAAGGLGGAASGVPVCRLGSHTAATLGTAAAGFRAFLHIVEPLAALRALRAHLRADSTGALVELGAKFHEERTRAANLGAGQHEPRVPWLDVLTAQVEAVLRERRQADAMTSQAVVYAAPHLLVHRVHDILHCCGSGLSPISRPPGLAWQLASASAGRPSI
jgi:hypothetical protein